MHIFFAMADGSCVAFFEVPEAPPAIKDTNTPAWVQHLALVVEDEDELLEKKAKLEAAGVDVIGPTDHGFCKSIYFFDYNILFSVSFIIDLYYYIDDTSPRNENII